MLRTNRRRINRRNNRSRKFHTVRPRSNCVRVPDTGAIHGPFDALESYSSIRIKQRLSARSSHFRQADPSLLLQYRCRLSTIHAYQWRHVTRYPRNSEARGTRLMSSLFNARKCQGKADELLYFHIYLYP